MRMPYIKEKSTSDEMCIAAIVQSCGHDFEALVVPKTELGTPVGYYLKRYLLEMFPFGMSFKVKFPSSAFVPGTWRGTYGYAKE